MRYPDFLKTDGKIGFVAPSFGCNMEPYRSAFVSAQEKLRALGHQSVLGPNCYAGDGIGISNSPMLCGKEFTEAYLSGESDVLISCGGGELMCEILDYVDWERIGKAKPKWFSGYSDNTNATFLLTTLCDVASIYAPCAAAYGMEPWHEAITDAYQLLRGKKRSFSGYPLWEKESLKNPENPLAPYHVTEPRKIRVFQENNDTTSVELKGRLLGGCMDCLVNLVGTKYDRVAEFADKYQEDGILWYLEACDLNVFGMRRAIWQMKHAGWFQHVGGFVIGRPYHHGETMMGLDQYHAVFEGLREYGVPVVMDADIGHLAPMIPVVCGAVGEVKVQGQDFRLSMDFC